MSEVLQHEADMAKTSSSTTGPIAKESDQDPSQEVPSDEVTNSKKQKDTESTKEDTDHDAEKQGSKSRKSMKKG